MVLVKNGRGKYNTLQNNMCILYKYDCVVFGANKFHKKGTSPMGVKGFSLARK